MAEKRIKIDVGDLLPGMFVAKLDRPWLETPFLFQGFEVRDESELEQLQELCKHVFVDAARSALSEAEILSRSAGDNAPEPAAKIFVTKPNLPDLAEATITDLKGEINYTNKVSTRDEAPKAAAAYSNAVQIMEKVLARVRAGRDIDAETISAAVTPMVDSVLRNPDAMSWLMTLQKQDDYTYHHSIACSVWAVVLGRHLGFTREDLDKLAVGGMLLDIGKTRVPQELLAKPESLSDPETEAMRKHVDFSMELALTSDALCREILDMIESHHERFDGSGYPRGLEDDDIPICGRIAGIVDCYDAMVTERPHAPARSTYDAIRELNRLAGKDFQKELVEQFVQALGMFPTGSLVELNTGEVGIVVEQNRVRRLRPTVLICLDRDKQPVTSYETIDLRKYPSKTSEPDAVWISHGHEAGAFDIDPRDYFM
ncbi:MAG: HD-GYP domain-containing protein [Gammaproteobacteria bacterium]|nr:HD-GYP domain-containing protein [Gammaproteobacteria bacterium]